MSANVGTPLTPATTDERLDLLARLCSLTRDGGLLPNLSADEATSLAKTAETEGVAGWLLHRLTESYADWPASAAMAKSLRQAAIGIVAHNAQIIGVMRDIESRLSGIGTVWLKGAALIESQCYADISHRLAGDIDLWVEPGRIYEARERLLDCGAKRLDNGRGPIESDTDAHLKAIEYHGVMVELHMRLFRKDFGWDLPGSLSDYATPSRTGKILRPDAMAYHLVLHAYKHYMWEHISLKLVVDLAKILDAAAAPSDLLRLLRETSADSEKAMRWAVGVAMPLLPEGKAKELASMGFSPLPFAANRSRKHVGTAEFKISALRLLIGGIRTRIRHAHGLRGKAAALVYSIRYEIDRTRLRYPGDSLAAAIMKRIVKKK